MMYTPHTLLALGAPAALALGCGEPEGPQLSVAGDTSLQVDAAAEVELEARYHDEVGVPLAGDVVFSIESEEGGAELSASEVSTDDFGIAEVVLDTGAGGDFDLEVVAEAPGAEPVRWEVEVAPVPPLDPSGTYELRSEFDIASGVAGRAGQAIDLIIDVTDDRADPTLWVLERLVNRLPEDYQFDPPYALALAVNRVILDVVAPAIVARVRDFGRDFGNVATNFGVISRLDVDGAEGGRRAEHVVTGFFVEHRGREFELELNDLGFHESPSTGVDIIVDEGEGTMSIADHELSVSYGALLIFLLENVLLEGFDQNLENFLREGVDCDTMADELVERVDALPSVATGAAREACARGIAAGVDYIRDRLLEIEDVEMTLALRGEAAPRDEVDDRRVDELASGHWEGEAIISGRGAALEREANTFTAERAAE